VEDLHEVRFISFGREGRMRHIIDALFESRGVQPQLVVETFNSETVCSLAAQGLGVSIVEPFSAGNYADGLAVRRFLPAIPYEFKLLFPRFRPRSRLAEAFATFLRTEIASEAEMLRPD
jgi:DNA-binding transcriptional LysR family regulator